MTILEIPTEAVSRRPSARKHISPWETIDGANGSTFQVCKHQMRLMSTYWRVFYCGVEYVCDDVDLDLLWMGKTPEQLGLDAIEPRSDDADDYAGSRMDREASEADASYQSAREEV